tara:strand:- start:460 stop:807 length:348 start_codon:yes stop_codon:yes gene_type:complete
MGVEGEFQEYFEALDRSGGKDRCYICRRTPAEVKTFFGFDEDGIPTDAEAFGLEDVVLGEADIMTYRADRPVCSVCQLNIEAIVALDESEVLLKVLRQMRDERDRLWPEGHGPHS